MSPLRIGRALSSVAITIGIALAVPAVGTGVPAPPPNPTDGELAQAVTSVSAQIVRVGELVNQVASTSQELSRLDDAVAAKREQVNKSLVDLQNARDVADAAAAAVLASRQALDLAGAQIRDAQAKFDNAARRAYTDGNTTASLAALVTSNTPDDVFDRTQVLDLLSRRHNAVIERLQRARTEEANKDSAARKAESDAVDAAQAAQDRKGEAEQAVAAARADADAQAARKAELEKQREGAETELAAAKSAAVGLAGQRAAYESWDAQRRAEEAAAQAAAEAARQAAVEAAARVAADQAATQRAAALAAAQRPHTAIEDDSSDYSDSSEYADSSDTSGSDSGRTRQRKKPQSSVAVVSGSEAVETVIDRAMSQMGVSYSWGGGNENGPTLGIRDGGVADSYGDYKRTGFDCSGLMVYAFAGVGISLPHYSGYQYTAGSQYPVDEMRRGDMLFWGSGGSEHVALYLGNGQMLEAPQSGDVVKVSPVRWGGLMPYVVRMIDDW
ncbi:C40 family peptidase [Skermania piniformis]|uniref:C40 family peptidase n=1 Tax=Skermania pinensis TaxID=39122 RepID=A0ABX8S9H4_9ACTN|nr:C40 family peptidase [Skermania piniformis]